jgi:hypothetical protein
MGWRLFRANYILFNTLRADFFQIGLLKELKEVPGGSLAPHLT